MCFIVYTLSLLAFVSCICAMFAFLQLYLWVSGHSQDNREVILDGHLVGWISGRTQQKPI